MVDNERLVLLVGLKKQAFHMASLNNIKPKSAGVMD